MEVYWDDGFMFGALTGCLPLLLIWLGTDTLTALAVAVCMDVAVSALWHATGGGEP